MLENGFEIIEKFETDIPLGILAEELAQFDLDTCKGGIRNVDKKSDLVSSFCKSASIINFAYRYLPTKPRLVRAIYFNKTPKNNWLVTWHQDKTVAVSNQFNLDGWGTWSIKDGVHHVQPPRDVLEQMVSLRIHIDSSSSDNGCLKLIPNSHKNGILSREIIKSIVSSSEFIECNIGAGGVLVMRPHILHSSSKAVNPANRRVLHLEYSSFELPGDVNWA